MGEEILREMAGVVLASMTDAEIAALREDAEIIARCEDPNEDFENIDSRPLTPEEIAWVTSLADGMFFNLSPQAQVDDILHLPAHVSARLLAQMSASEREKILSRLPEELAQGIISAASVGVA